MIDLNNLVNKLLEPAAMAVWLPILTGLLGLHLRRPGYMGKKDGDQ